MASEDSFTCRIFASGLRFIYRFRRVLAAVWAAFWIASLYFAFYPDAKGLFAPGVLFALGGWTAIAWIVVSLMRASGDAIFIRFYIRPELQAKRALQAGRTRGADTDHWDDDKSSGSAHEDWANFHTDPTSQEGQMVYNNLSSRHDD